MTPTREHAVAPTLADLRRAFFSPAANQSVTDAEYTQLAALYAQGVTLPGLAGGGGQGEVNLRGSTTANWTRKLMTVDANAPDSALTIEHGKWTSRVIGGTGVQSNRREVWTVPSFPSCRAMRVRSRFASDPPNDNFVEHVLGMNFSQDATKMRQVSVWDFGIGLLQCGVWESNLDGSGFVSAPAAQKEIEAFTGGSRTTNVVTLTGLAAGANTRWFVGDAIQVDAADNVYDGAFVITAVTSTTLTYTQAAADDASSGAGTFCLLGRANLLLSSTPRIPTYSASGLTGSRTGGFSTITGLTAGHGFKVGDRVTTTGFVDATYNSPRLYVTAVTNTTIVLAQPGVADDADAGGSGVVTRSLPYFVEARRIGNFVQARCWPDASGHYNGANPGPINQGPPAWESEFANTWDLTTVAGATVPTEGVATIGAAHHSSASPVRHDNIEASPLYGYNF